MRKWEHISIREITQVRSIKQRIITQHSTGPTLQSNLELVRHVGIETIQLDNVEKDLMQASSVAVSNIWQSIALKELKQ